MFQCDICSGLWGQWCHVVYCSEAGLSSSSPVLAVSCPALLRLQSPVTLSRPDLCHVTGLVMTVLTLLASNDRACMSWPHVTVDTDLIVRRTALSRHVGVIAVNVANTKYFHFSQGSEKLRPSEVDRRGHLTYESPFSILMNHSKARPRSNQ